MNIKRLTLGISMLAIGLITQNLLVGSAYAATMTWDGGGVDNNFSTAENWVGDVAPVDNDDLVFDSDLDVNLVSQPLNNDLANGTNFISITTQGSAASNVSIEGNNFTVGNITTGANVSLGIHTGVELSTNSTFAIDAQLSFGETGDIFDFDLSTYNLNVTNADSTANLLFFVPVIGSGDITFGTNSSKLYFYVNNTFTGDVIVNDGLVVIASANGLGTAAGTTTIASGAGLFVATGSLTGLLTIPENITIGGTSVDYDTCVTDVTAIQVDSSVQGCGFGAGGGDSVTPNVTFSGTITLTANTNFYSGPDFDQSTIEFVTMTLGGFTFTIDQENISTVKVNGSTVANASKTVTTITDSQPSTSLTVNPNSRVIVNGTRGATYVYVGAELYGTGTVGDLTVDGTLAPGNSPGCINTGNLTLNGTLEVELAGTTACSGYDQTVVTGTVSVGGTLDVVHLSDFLPASGNTFVIINNDGSDAVTGTFSGMANGSTFVVDGVTYRINYDGGDGNDVVLTAVTVPDSPNTGSTSNNRAIIAILAAVTFAAGIRLAIVKSKQY